MHQYFMFTSCLLNIFMCTYCCVAIYGLLLSKHILVGHTKLWFDPPLVSQILVGHTKLWFDPPLVSQILVGHTKQWFDPPLVSQILVGHTKLWFDPPLVSQMSLLRRWNQVCRICPVGLPSRMGFCDLREDRTSGSSPEGIK
ncbi:unnamed protein product [Candidula unifasciata]|uniref:Uncharacterized protein n=1 Tax=Candidula unifasciata TaxID=100452 RepID=A0A8S3Z8D2_9EUPU|nr:unnamed protein product [Candidula unifasciata]